MEGVAWLIRERKCKYVILGNMATLAAWRIADILVTALVALVMGLLFSWWSGVVVFLAGLALVKYSTRKRPMTEWSLGRGEHGEWLEEWHDDMRRRQIGPYEWRD